MTPPGWVCEKLYEISPMLRLGWVGQPPAYPGELNPGSFALVELRELKKVGRMDQPQQYTEFWDVQVEALADKLFRTVKIDRGPIFSRHGVEKRDWDNTRFKPMYVQNFDEQWGFTPQDVFDGTILPFCRRQWLTPEQRRADKIKRLRIKGRRLNQKLHDLAGQMTDEWMHTANKTGETGVDMPWEFAKKDLPKRYVAMKEQGAYDFENHFVQKAGLE